MLLMPEPPFYLQIADKDGVVIRTHAGGRHEADFINLCVQAILPRGVGFLKTQTAVEQAIRDGLTAAIHGLKIDNPFDVINE